MRKGKEIETQNKKPVLHDDLSKKLVIFEYKGLPTEINDFVSLAQQAGLSMKAQSEEELGERISQFKMSFFRAQLGTFLAVLHEWKPGKRG